MHIRKAKAKDAKGIIEVNIKTWITTYSGIIPQEVLNNKEQTIKESIKKCEETVEKDDNVLVAIKNAKVVGIASYGKARAVNKEKTGELYSIYVLKDYQGQGIGEQLFKKVKNILYDKGYNEMVVTCLKQNPYNKFYKKMGGEIIKVINSNICGFEMEENLIHFKNLHNM